MYVRRFINETRKNTPIDSVVCQKKSRQKAAFIYNRMPTIILSYRLYLHLSINVTMQTEKKQNMTSTTSANDVHINKTRTPFITLFSTLENISIF